MLLVTGLWQNPEESSRCDESLLKQVFKKKKVSLWAGVRYEVTLQCGELNSERGCVLYPAPLLWVRLLSQRLSNTPRQFHTACICEQLRKWRCGSFQSHQRRHSRLHLLSFVAPSLIIFACFTWFFLRVTWMQQVCTDTKIILGSCFRTHHAVWQTAHLFRKKNAVTKHK